MFFYLNALVSALLFTVVLGIAVESTENTQKRDKPTGIVVSFSNNYVDWKRISAAYHSFAYIWATAGDGRRYGTLIMSDADVSFQRIGTLTSPRTTLGPRMQVSFGVLSTSPTQHSLPALLRPITFCPTAENGLVTA